MSIMFILAKKTLTWGITYKTANSELRDAFRTQPNIYDKAFYENS